LLVGCAILKSGWDNDDLHNTDIQVVPDDEVIQTSTSKVTPTTPTTKNGIIVTN
jgi:hypothetical protein